ncbi:hypothetical protein PTMSG1_04986 [Pyrenophora teres f. maculata]|nr:hypothetical protein PTMSG1_04986 [Pyrenophora teres f. maculata]
MKWTIVLAIAPLLSGAFAGICCEQNKQETYGCNWGAPTFCCYSSNLKAHKRDCKGHFPNFWQQFYPYAAGSFEDNNTCGNNNEGKRYCVVSSG